MHADFGIARTLAEPNGLTATGMTVGTFAYSAPEQLLGEETDARADQYALAATAYHLLSGSQLFPSSNVAVAINRQLNNQPPNLADTRPELARLDPVLHMALAKQADDRFGRCSDFAAALAEQIGSAGEIGPADPTLAAAAWKRDRAAASQSPTQPGRRSGTSRTRALVVAAGVGAVLISGTLMAWHPWQEHAPAPHESSSTASAVQTETVESGSPGVSARTAAEAIKAAVPEITGITDLNDENDANHLLGRPHGYVAATVLVDSRAGCLDGPGVDCGAVIEQFPDQAAARRRADYIQQVTASMPIVGSEWSVVKGDLLLRISGKLTPAQERAFEAAFTAVAGQM